MIPSPSPFRWRSSKGNLHCALCRCRIPGGEREAIVHEAGARHRRNLERSETPSRDGDGQCTKICDVPLFRLEQYYSPYGNPIFVRQCAPSVKEIERHRRGRKHQAKSEWRESKCDKEKETRKREAVVVAVLAICRANGLSDDLVQGILQLAGHPCSLVELASVQPAAERV